MISLLVIAFGVILIYLAVAERMKTYNTLIAVQGLLLIFITFLLSYLLHDQQIQVKYFTGAIAAIFTGLYLIIVHKQVFTHMMGYLTIENGIFLLSLAIGNEMPL